MDRDTHRDTRRDTRSIPNVSSIYRELTHLAHSPQTEGDRQQQHMRIMRRLADSKQDHQRLMNGLHQETPHNFTHSSSNWNSNVESQLYGSSMYGTGINFQTAESTKRTKWRPPNIRYRHIEDQIERDRQLQLKNQSKTVKNIPISSRGEEGMEQKHYQEHSQEHQEEQLVQRQPNESRLNMNSELELKRPKSFLGQNRQISQFKDQYRDTNYKDKIQSYYELCRKRIQPVPSEAIFPSSTNQNSKFLRKGASTKAEDIARAMKLLSDGGN